MKFKVFKAIRPPKDLAKELSAPPYDVLTSEEARKMAFNNPYSFLHVTKPEIDLPEDTDLYSNDVYNKARTNFLEFQKKGYLNHDDEEGFYIYQQKMNGHTQTGLVGLCHVEDYENNVIKKHENTLKKKEDDRTRHVEALMANAGPIFLTYRGTKEIDEWIDQQKKTEPLYNFVADDKVSHTIWKTTDNLTIPTYFKNIPCAYVADGHHRSASAIRAASACRKTNTGHTGSEPYNWFLTVLFPSEQLKVFAYNRVVKDLNGRTPSSFLDEIKTHFDVQSHPSPPPPEPRKINLYLDKHWHTLSLQPPAEATPVQRLDVSMLQNLILQPLLDIDDPKNNPRISFVGGIHGTAKLKERVDAGKYAVAFSLYPVNLEDMMAVADENKIMPPKSTWFEPKLRSGLLVYSFNPAS